MFELTSSRDVLSGALLLAGGLAALAVLAIGLARLVGTRVLGFVLAGALAAYGAYAGLAQSLRFHAMDTQGGQFEVQTLWGRQSADCAGLEVLATQTRSGCFFRVFRGDDLLFRSVEAPAPRCAAALDWLRDPVGCCFRVSCRSWTPPPTPSGAAAASCAAC